MKSPPHKSNPRLELGQRGEKLAEGHLRKNGYKILHRNFRAPKGGEVDIVCRDKRKNTLVFVEVKTKTSTAHGDAVYAVNEEKQRLITRGALAWLRLLGNPDITFRFDIVEVLVEESGTTITVTQDAFQLSDPYIY